MLSRNVSLARCQSYDYDLVKEAVKKSAENLGGFGQYIKKGDKVLLKANLLQKKSPESMVTTHPAVVRALCELIMEFGAHVIIGDSPGGPFNEKLLAGVYKVTGMEEVAALTGAMLNRNFKFAEADNPLGLLLKKLTVTDMINDVDKIISVSKLKTHEMMIFTGAVKNMFGIVPGIMKAEYHLKMQRKDDFANALIDICLCANPVLSFMDGIVGMEGAGPSAGDPRAVNVVIASDSPYHLDKVACEIAGIPFENVYTIKNCIKRKICAEGLADVKLLGDDIESFKLKDFKAPKNSDAVELVKAPKLVGNLVNAWLRPIPVFNSKECSYCGICADNCPAKVISKNDNGLIVDFSGCIRCYCCQELCPNKAISIKKPLIGRLVFRR